MPTVGPMDRSPVMVTTPSPDVSSAAPVRITTPASVVQLAMRARSARLARTTGRSVGQLGTVALAGAAPQPPRTASASLLGDRRIDCLAAADAHVALDGLGEPEVQRIGDQGVSDRRLDDLG